LEEMQRILDDISVILRIQSTQCLTEDACKWQSVVEITKRTDCQYSLRLFHSSTHLLNSLINVGKEGGDKQDDEFVLRCVGVTIYNDCFAAHRLILSSYSQVSINILRSILVSALLLEKFSRKPESIKEWRRADSDTRWNKYRPSKLFSFLKSQHGIHDKNRKPGIERVFNYLSELGTHPSLEATLKLLMEKDTLYYGPRFNAESFVRLLAELARISSYATICLASAFGTKLNKDLVPKIEQFRGHRKKWTDKYCDFPDVEKIETAR